MDISLERTRIMFTNYNSIEKRKIEDLVATVDKVFLYEDEDREDPRICIPPGMLKNIQGLFPKVPIKDETSKYWDHLTIQPVNHNAQPRNQLQVDFINFTLQQAKKKQKVAGILSPGSGKTFMACYSSIKLKLRTLIVVPTTNIRNQWAETLTTMFEVPEDRVLMITNPQQFVGVKADFVVVSQASLAALNKKYDLEAIMKTNKFGIKIIDEVQMWFHNIIKVDGSSNICHNWYLTGTFGRSSEDENRIYQIMFGDLNIFREEEKKATIFNRRPGNIYGMKPHMHVKMMWTNSGISEEDLKKVTSSKRYSEREGKWIRYGISIPAYTNVVIPEDGTKTQFLDKILQVVALANKKVTYGKMLVLTPTIASVEIFHKYISEMYPKLKVGTIHSRKSRVENDKVKSECDIMISTVKSCGTGFDVKDLSKLVVADQFKSWILADQVSGRLRRRDDGKDTHMWDIVDSDVPQLRAWANARADVLKKKCKSFKVIDI